MKGSLKLSSAETQNSECPSEDFVAKIKSLVSQHTKLSSSELIQEKTKIKNKHTHNFCVLFLCCWCRGSQHHHQDTDDDTVKSFAGIPLDLFCLLLPLDGFFLCFSSSFVRSFRSGVNVVSAKKVICTIIPKKCFYTSEAEKSNCFEFSSRRRGWLEWVRRWVGQRNGKVEIGRKYFYASILAYRLGDNQQRDVGCEGMVNLLCG